MERFQLFESAVEGALDAGLVTGQTVELFLELIVVEKVGIGLGAGAEFGFHATDAAEVPGGGDELVEEGVFERAFGFDFIAEFGEHFVELGAIFGADDEIGGGEAVLP
jgi:hypothetical protein